ncbi:MAG: Syncollin [Pseudomonadota bacterium]|jgi:hypothetical protein
MRFFSVALAFLLLGSLVAMPVSAHQPGCLIFNEEEWEGQGRYLQPNTQYSSLDAFRNRTKSVMLSPACRLVVFERENFNGSKHEFDQDRKRLGSWETKVESLRCRCE